MVVDEDEEDEGSHERLAKFVKASVVDLASPDDAGLIWPDVCRLSVSGRVGEASLDEVLERGNH